MPSAKRRPKPICVLEAFECLERKNTILKTGDTTVPKERTNSLPTRVGIRNLMTNTHNLSVNVKLCERLNTSEKFIPASDKFGPTFQK